HTCHALIASSADNRSGHDFQMFLLGLGMMREVTVRLTIDLIDRFNTKSHEKGRYKNAACAINSIYGNFKVRTANSVHIDQRQVQDSLYMLLQVAIVQTLPAEFLYLGKVKIQALAQR